MATKNNRRTILTKKILKDSLLELMQSKPIAKITIKEICNLSDMSRSTFYLHYQDQYELLEDIENEVLEKTFENLADMDTELNSLDSIDFFLKYVKENKTTFGILLCQSENKAFQQGIMNSVQKHVQSIIPAYYENDKEQYIYTFIMYGSLSMIVDWINSDFNIPSRELAKLIYHSCNNVMTK
ncbi:MAG: TetR-like C-terminal domain-containing protein [Lachnospiraceae bacterium]|nr:TetR-like C-terminal domain-containing protein [Lachnospiraceae bacterium]